MTWTVASPSMNKETQARLQWVADMMNASEGVATQLKVTPQAIVAQAAEESAWGQSKQGRFGLFGQKAGPSWKGLVAMCPTREWENGQYVYETDAFRDYDSLADCLADHFALLNENPVYRESGVFDGKGDDAFFAALQKAGYATDPDYASKLSAVELAVDTYLDRLTQNGKTMQRAVPRLLNIGDSGPDVRMVQGVLHQKGYLDEDQVDGVFGPVTFAAVTKFQTDNKIDADGVVGQMTRGLLGLTF